MPERYSDRTRREQAEGQPSKKRRHGVIAATAVVAVAATALFVPTLLEKPDKTSASSSDLPSDLSGPPSLSTPSQKDYIPNKTIKIGDKITVCDGTFVDMQVTSEGRHVAQSIVHPAVTSEGDPYFQTRLTNSGEMTLQGVVAEKTDYWLDDTGERILLPLCGHETYKGVVMGESAGPFATTDQEVLKSGSIKSLLPGQVCALGGFSIHQVTVKPEQAVIAAKTCG